MITPLVSVVIATYRREASFKKALFSLAEQTYKNIEIIIVDDSANENWNSKILEIVEQFRKQFPNIILYHIVNKENKGSARARNIGIEKASGEYITFLDDDDIYLPKKIESQLINLLENGADFGVTDLYLYNSVDFLVDKRIRSYIKKTDKDSLLKYHLMHHITGTDTIMFKKAYLEEIGGFDPIDVGDEFYLIQKAILGDGRFSYLNECFVKAYIHSVEQGISAGEGKIAGEEKLFEFKKGFFDSLEASEVKYIKARHHLVLAYAYFKSRKLKKFVSNFLKAFFASPIQLFKIISSR